MNFARKGLHGCCADVLLLTYCGLPREVLTQPHLSRQPVKITLNLKGNEHVRNVRVFSNQGKKRIRFHKPRF